MSDENRPGDVPPDLPPEYAEAYRRGYERAFQVSDDMASDSAPTQRVELPPTPPEESPERTQVTGPLFADETPPDVEPTQTFDRLDAVLARSAIAEPEAVRNHREPVERPVWFVPAILGGLVLVLLIGAFVFGKVFSSSVAGSHVGAEKTRDGVVMNEDGSTGSPKTHKPKGKPYAGAVKAVAIKRATATCEAPKGVDAAGHPVDYSPKNVYDNDMTTAWRCDGDGVGQKLTLTLPKATKVAEVGLVPGYAKTDPRSGANRYAENDRITKVRWVFSDGTAVEQHFDGSPGNRSLQAIRIPPTASKRVTIEILAVSHGPRHTTAVSEIRVGRTV